MRVAIVHYWFVGMRGGEKVVESLCRVFPEADVFTHVFDREKVSPLLQTRIKATTFIGKLPFATRFYKIYLPLMPAALEQIDLRRYDLVISSESGPTKGVLVPARAVHICYCHSPMRYLWEMYQDYIESSAFFRRLGLRICSHYLRLVDAASSSHVDFFVANSRCVAGRVRRAYNRDATVIYPPVDTDAFGLVADHLQEDYYLMVGELVAYKRFDLGIEAARQLGRRLIVVGNGEMRKNLEANAGPHVTFLGSVPLAELRQLYARCRALLFPGEEDFGIVPVEAMASGRPVIAFGQGGATESVRDGVTGLFFYEQSVAELCDAIRRSESMSWNKEKIRAHAASFGAERFRSEISAFVQQVFDQRAASERDFRQHAHKLASVAAE